MTAPSSLESTYREWKNQERLPTGAEEETLALGVTHCMPILHKRQVLGWRLPFYRKGEEDYKKQNTDNNDFPGKILIALFTSVF